MTGAGPTAMKRRDLFGMIGKAAGGAALYQAMASLGHAAESHFTGPPKLDGNVKGAKVLVLGAGMAGLVAAYELRKAGYKVKVLDYNDRVGGRSWTLRGGDVYTELGGHTQHCGFDPGLYINPGPWRLPYHHYAMLSYCQQFGVELEPFTQVNYNAYLHSPAAFDGKPQRYRTIAADYWGGIAELLAKATNQGKLDDTVSVEDREILLESLKSFGALDKNYAYRAGPESANQRGYDIEPGGGLMPLEKPSQPLKSSDVLKSRLWNRLAVANSYEFQTPLFQPVGGMDMLAKAMGRELKDIIRLNSKVTAIMQNDSGVTVTYEDTKKGSAAMTESADWCVCTIPLSVLSQIKKNVSPSMDAAINAVPYAGMVKVGLQFKRRFWEQDDKIYGGHTYTNQANSIIGYPMWDYFSKGKGVILGAYMYGPHAYEFASMPPEDRVKKTLEYGAQIHPQYNQEFDNGIAVVWQRAPWIMGCFGLWTEANREKHYNDLCQIDGRMVLAGEHASYIPAWQEGAVLSSLDAISRLHKRVVAA
jgi:monoamine oxidase